MTLFHKTFRVLLSRSAVKRSLLLLLLMQLPLTLSADNLNDGDDLPYVEIKTVTDFSQLTETARIERKIIMLEISASYCEFCDLLEEEFIKPMLRNDDYAKDVLIRKIEMDSVQTITDLSGDSITAGEFTRRFKVRFTPTLLFLDSNGNEVAPRIPGINSLDLYGGYLDDALQTGLKKIKSQ